MCKLGVEIGEAYVKLQLTRKLCMPQRTWDPNTAVYARPTLPDVPLVKGNCGRVAHVVDAEL